MTDDGSQYTREEALAFIESLRLTVAGKVGFAWLSSKLTDLEAYVGDLAHENECLVEENERLIRYLDSIGQRDGYEATRSTDDDA